ncbi:MAG: hypothetical protein U0350_25590 [Caldilineaceae bacterium]
MAIKATFIGAIASLILERPARKKTLTEFIAKLEEAGSVIEACAAKAADTPGNREQLAHIAGIERWGQRRLRVFLGEPYVQDEYDGYRPTAELNYAQLQDFFHATRQETVQIARKIADAKVSDAATVPHNFVGKLSARAWLRYLDIHANTESKRIR